METGLTISQENTVETDSGILVKNGDVFTNDISTSLLEGSGSVLIQSEGNITIGKIDASSFLEDGGSSGSINLTANNGNITTEDLHSRGFRDAGSIIINTPKGDITTGDQDAGSREGNGGVIINTAGGKISVDDVYVRSTRQGNGGKINFIAYDDITTNSVQSYATIGNGGTIDIMSETGSITTSIIASGSILLGDGGAINLTANNDLKINEIISGSSIGNGGDITLTAGDNIIIETGAVHEFFSGQCGTTGSVNVSCGSDGSVILTPTDTNIYPGINFFLFSITGKITIAKGNKIIADPPSDSPDTSPTNTEPVENNNNITVEEPTIITNDNSTDENATNTSPGDNAEPVDDTNNITVEEPTVITSNNQTDEISAEEPTVITSNNQAEENTQNTSPAANTDLLDENNNILVEELTIITGTNQGDGGDITGNSGGDFEAGSIATLIIKEGDGGNIDIKSRDNITVNKINTSTGNGDGGDIGLEAVNTINTSSLDFRSRNGQGSYGNLFLKANEINIGPIIWGFNLDNLLTIETTEITQNILDIESRHTRAYKNYLGEYVDKQLMTVEQSQQRLHDIHQQTGLNPAVIYIDISSEQLELVLLHRNGKPVSEKNAKVKINELKKKILVFRDTVKYQKPTDYRKDAQELYDLLIKPLEAELKAQKIDTLLFSMGTKLDLFPLAALYDGKQFLIENYRLSLIPSFTLADTHYNELHNPQVLAMGISKFSDRPSLPNVPMEISTITQLWQGKSFLNEEVTLENLKVQRQKPFEIIHIATHAKFNEQIQEKSWIQLWDKKLRFDDLRKLKLYESPKVKLLVLSACETALGDKYAEMGFAGLAVKAGVNSAVASLWRVDDQATFALMMQFYHDLKSSPIKAEALRQAQIALLKGEMNIESGKLILGKDLKISLPTQLANLESQDFSHPHYWAGFTMIGSPW